MPDLPSAAPDVATLAKLLEENSHAQLAERLGVSRQTIGYWAKRAGLGRAAPPMTHKDILPWKIRAADHHDSIARALRWLDAARKGTTLEATQQREVDRLAAFLEKEDVVVDYERERGFFFRRRDPKIDAPEDVIRRPIE